MKSITSITLIAAAMMVASVATAKVEITGNNEQTTKLKNSAVTNTAIGAGSKAKLSLNSVEGNVKIGGNNKQSLSATNSAILSTAGGAGSSVETNLGTVSGK